MAGKRAAAAAALDTVTDVQWDAARIAFKEGLQDTWGLQKEKYNQILNLLSDWDSLDPKERRELSGGNHVFWNKKYVVKEVNGVKEIYVKPTEGDGAVEVTKAKRLSHRERMFDDIKQIHIESALLSCVALYFFDA